MKKIILTLSLFLLTFMFGYSKASDSINSFDSELFTKLCNSNQNVNYSSISIYSMLYALLQGSEGETAEQLKNILNTESTPEFENQMKNIFLNTENMTDSIWYKKSLKIKESYNQFIKDYGFIIKPTDFNKSAKTRKAINSFISEKTHKMIENFLSEDLDKATRLVLLNTLYFNQKWYKPFEKEDTYNEDFFTTATSSSKVPMMHKTSNYSYYEDNNFKALEMDYKDNRYSMLIFLPKETEYDFSKTNISDLVQNFYSNCSSNKVELTLPKFDITTKYELTPVLNTLGIKDAFIPGKAELTKIFTNANDLFVDSVLHQVRITVNEKETKAAAVTMVSVKATAFMPEKNYIFKADHPFIYVIRDNQLGINLFTGIIRNPVE